jgi:hypothetical protein
VAHQNNLVAEIKTCITHKTWVKQESIASSHIVGSNPGNTVGVIAASGKHNRWFLVEVFKTR